MKKNNEEAMEMQSGEDLAYTKVIGIDVANSTLKAYTDDASIVYRNTLKKINDAGVIFSFNTDYKMYVYNNEVYEVGDLSVIGSGGRGQQRYRSDDFQVESVIGLSKLLTPGKVEKIRVVTGVPSNYAKNTEVINKLKETLLGVHTVKEVTWAKVDEITFDVVDVLVVAQPLGTMYDYMVDDNGEYINPGLLKKKVIVIDIGWGTLDLAILESSKVRSTFGFEIGVSDYIASIQEDVNNRMPEANIYGLNAHELDNQLLQSTTIETPFGEFDLSSIVAEHKMDSARTIYQKVMSLGLEFSQFYRIILTGGGAMLFEKELRDQFQDSRLVIKENAQISNCRGFYLLGKF